MLSFEGKVAFVFMFVFGGVEAARGLLTLADRWTWARAKYSHLFHNWSTIAQPKPLVFDKLVELKLPNPAMPEMIEGPQEHLRRRDGFKLTDPRASQR